MQVIMPLMNELVMILVFYLLGMAWNEHHSISSIVMTDNQCLGCVCPWCICVGWTGAESLVGIPYLINLSHDSL